MNLLIQCYIQVITVFGSLAVGVCYIFGIIWLMVSDRSPLPDKDWLRLSVGLILLSFLLTAIVYVTRVHF